MSQPFEPVRQRAIRTALARQAYKTDRVRLADPDLAGRQWLVASPRGVFAVGGGAAQLAIHGWFFGICRDGDHLYLFENCARRNRAAKLGRLIRFTLHGGRLSEPVVLAKDLDANCHQVRLISDLVCLVDTAGQRILRFTRDGAPVDPRQLLPLAHSSDTSGAYCHINAIAEVGGRVAVMLHNGKARPERPSELAWLDPDWTIAERTSLPGHGCHDIAADEAGTLWHSASMSGEIFTSDGRRARISEHLMTRGIAFAGDRIAVGLSSFGPRQLRDSLGGALAILDRDLRLLETITLDGPPTDIVAL